MFARSLTLRACALFASITLTVAMLGGIGGLASVEHGDASLADSQAATSELGRVPG